jgi:TonB family protein
MIGENHKWLVKHEVCSNCGFSREEMITNLTLSMQGYFTFPMSISKIKSPKPPKSQSLSVPANVSGANQHPYSDPLLRLKEPIKVKKTKLPLEEFKYKLAEKQYNQLIGKRIKKDLMFFRHKNRQQARENLKARLRLQINQSGKVIDRRLLKTSGSSIFDKMVLDTVDLLKLPPPMELLIREPPYVVTILIQP